MKKLTTLRRSVTALAMTGAICASMTAMTAPVAAHSDDQTSEVRELATFTKIRIKGGLELDLVAGKDQRVEVSAGRGHLAEVETYVRGDTLVIDMDHDDDDGIHINSDDVHVTISMAMLEELEVLGAVDAEMSGIDSKNLRIDIKGAGDVEIEGTCGSLELEIKGAGDVDAEELKCADVQVSVKGVGEARVYASESVDADVSGIGSITVYGEPGKVRQSDGFLGSIRIK